MSYTDFDPAPKAKPNPHPNRTKKVEIGRGLWILIDPNEDEEKAKERFLARLKENNLKSGFKGRELQKKNEELAVVTRDKSSEND